MEDDEPITYTINDGKKVVYEYNPNLRELTRKLDELPNKKSLTLSDIYEITLWKLNRYPQINQDIIDELNDLQDLKSEEINKTRIKNILKKMLDSSGIGLAMASTYLRFANPKVFQIIDRHAYRVAFNYEESLHDYSYLSHKKQIDIYFKYLAELHKIETTGYHGYRVGFENLDRFLYDVDKASGYTLKESPNPIPTEKDIIRWIEKVIHSSKEISPDNCSTTPSSK